MKLRFWPRTRKIAASESIEESALCSEEMLHDEEQPQVRESSVEHPDSEASSKTEDVQAEMRRFMAVDHQTNGIAETTKRSAHGVYADLYDDNCIITSITINSRDINSYIKGHAEPILGPDYYYGYLYRNGVLTFIATRSPIHTSGMLSVFTPAFLQQGEYSFRRGATFHHLVTTEQGTTDTLVYQKPNAALDLNEAMNIPLNKKNIPSTLWLRWSLQKERRSILVLVGMAFLISAGFCLAMALRYSAMAQEVAREPAPAPPPKTLKLNPEIAEILKAVSTHITGKGVIKAVRAQGDHVAFALSFYNEADARNFMLMVGPTAVYENGIVGISIDASKSNTRVPPAGPVASLK